ATLSVLPPGSFVTAPSGTITFYDDFEGTTTVLAVITLGGPPGSSPALTAVGTHLITAVYSGDSYFNGSTSVGITQTVIPGTSPVPPSAGRGAPKLPGDTTSVPDRAAATDLSLGWYDRETGAEFLESRI